MHEDAVIGLATTIIFPCLQWAIPTMPRRVAWSGVIAGLVILAAALAPIHMNLSLPAIALFLIGAICIGGAAHLAFKPKAPVQTSVPASPPTGNAIGNINGNTGIITQGQQGDNSTRRN